jgi:Zn-dependent oligopeptidase
VRKSRRNCRKRLYRRLGTETLTQEAADAESVNRRIRAVREHQNQLLENYKHELARRSKSLDTEDQIWRYLNENLTEAVKWQIEAEFRELCYVAAGKFANVRMLRQIAVYSHRGRSE